MHILRLYLPAPMHIMRSYFLVLPARAKVLGKQRKKTMKKLIVFAAIAVAAMGAFALESANTVGYVSTPVAANTWQINGCQFQNVGDDEMDLQDLVVGFASTSVEYGDGNAFKATAPCIQIQNRDANGNLTAGNKFYYYLADAATDAAGTQVKPGWADEMGYYVGDGCYVGAVKIVPGTAVWFKDTQAAAPNAQTAGEVVGEATASAIKANAGNWSLTTMAQMIWHRLMSCSSTSIAKASTSLGTRL